MSEELFLCHCQLNNKHLYLCCVSYTQQIQVPCASVERLGKVTDGGWEVCEDSPYKPTTPCLVYSFGLVCVCVCMCVCACMCACMHADM